MALKFADSLRSDQIDCAATEAAPRHPRSEYARQVFSKLNHQIQFGTAHLIVIAQTGVRIMHQSSKPTKVSAFKGGGRVSHAGVLAYDVTTSSVNYLR